jgi:hypothetical protein
MIENACTCWMERVRKNPKISQIICFVSWNDTRDLSEWNASCIFKCVILLDWKRMYLLNGEGQEKSKKFTDWPICVFEIICRISDENNEGIFCMSIALVKLKNMHTFSQ